MHLLHIFVDELTELIHRKSSNEHEQRYHSNGVQKAANNSSYKQDASYGADYEIIHIIILLKHPKLTLRTRGA